jgi:hypothetical protein
MRHFNGISYEGEVWWVRRCIKPGPKNWKIIPERPYESLRLYDYTTSPLDLEVHRRRIYEALGVPKEFMEPEQ